MATEIQEEYAEAIYGMSYYRCSGIERYRIDTLIKRKSLEELKTKTYY